MHQGKHPSLVLRAVNEDPLLERLELLLSSLAPTSTKHELSPQLPLLGNVPLVLNLLVYKGVVVLEVGTETFSVESSPCDKYAQTWSKRLTMVC
jgi:hypothetical protein